MSSLAGLEQLGNLTALSLSGCALRQLAPQVRQQMCYSAAAERQHSTAPHTPTSCY